MKDGNQSLCAPPRSETAVGSPLKASPSRTGRTRGLTVFALSIITALPLPSFATPAQPSAVLIDAIVASVDEKPITLRELSTRLTPPRSLSIEEAAKDAEAERVLDQLIVEKLIEEEAKAKRVSVADTEIDDYMREVAQRNGLSPAEFEAALAREGKTLPTYKQQVRVDILRARLASLITKGGVSTTDAEIDEYISQHPELNHQSNSIKLHRIVIAKGAGTPEEAQAKVEQVMQALENGEKFTEVASRLSDTTGSAEGSLLGVIAESDLSSEISGAVNSLKAGEHSKPIESPVDYQVFFVEQRFSEDSDEDDAANTLRDEARQILQKQKTQERLSSYFVEDLYKHHSVDKRL